MKELHDAVSTQSGIVHNLKTSSADKNDIKSAIERLDILKNLLENISSGQVFELFLFFFV